MPTSNPRINITLEKSLATLLEEEAKQENKSVASFAKELILEALERREDMALSALAEIREDAHTKRIKHKNAWK